MHWVNEMRREFSDVGLVLQDLILLILIEQITMLSALNKSLIKTMQELIISLHF